MRAFQGGPGFRHGEVWGRSAEGLVWKGMRGGKTDTGQPGKLAQNFTSCDCGWIPQAAKGPGQNWDQLCVCRTRAVTKASHSEGPEAWHSALLLQPGT